MEFREQDELYEIKIDGVWYYLGACINCEEVHATFSDWLKVDAKIKCCNSPDNYHDVLGVKIIKNFVKKWR